MRHGHPAGRRLTSVGDQVEVEGARRVGRMAVAAETGFDAMQGDQGLLQAELGLDEDDAIQIGRVRGVRPGRRSPPARAPHNLQSGLIQALDRRFQERLGGVEFPLQVRSERDDDGLIAMLSR